jgi:hypothetical protein
VWRCHKIFREICIFDQPKQDIMLTETQVFSLEIHKRSIMSLKGSTLFYQYSQKIYEMLLCALKMQFKFILRAMKSTIRLNFHLIAIIGIRNFFPPLDLKNMGLRAWRIYFMLN